MSDPIALKHAQAIEAMIRRDYVAARVYLNWLDTVEGKWRYLHSQRAAIERVQHVFQMTFGIPQAWPSFLPPVGVMRYQNQVGYFCHRLGVKALVDDMRLAKEQDYKPDSLLWFVRSSKDGQARASRWEWLVTVAIETETRKAKEEEAKAAEDLHRRGILPDVKAAEPDWVAECRQTIKDLNQKTHLSVGERRTIQKARTLLERYGYAG